MAELRASGSGILRPPSPRREQRPPSPSTRGQDVLAASLADELAKAMARRRGALASESESVPTSPRGRSDADWF